MNSLIGVFQRQVLTRRWLTFAVMCTSFGLFGAGTLNLFSMFGANWDLITQHGAMALKDGAAQQLFELLLTLFIAMLNYVIFKACEYRLVQGLIYPVSKDLHR